jgi:hypothetical protein
MKQKGEGHSAKAMAQKTFNPPMRKRLLPPRVQDRVRLKN